MGCIFFVFLQSRGFCLFVCFLQKMGAWFWSQRVRRFEAALTILGEESKFLAHASTFQQHLSL